MSPPFDIRFLAEATRLFAIGSLGHRCLVPQLLNRLTPKQVAEASRFRIVRSIRGIGFQPVALKMTGWTLISVPAIGRALQGSLADQPDLSVTRGHGVFETVGPIFLHTSVSLSDQSNKKISIWGGAAWALRQIAGRKNYVYAPFVSRWP